MDPTTARLLDDLKDLLREKVISLAEWRAETAAIHARALAAAAAAPLTKSRHTPACFSPLTQRREPIACTRLTEPTLQGGTLSDP